MAHLHLNIHYMCISFGQDQYNSAHAIGPCMP